MKTTKGKWEIIGQMDDLRVIVENSNNPHACDGIRQICEVRQHGYEIPDYVEAVANAKLIAAAPELLAALERMLNADRRCNKGGFSEHQARIHASAVIKKATK